ncbi:hypothetical protein BD779DRAFT_1685262 [Infundibulicybe gibba]|nr:hypothetical protein BD779DRAFT_1685262 [Infundibulicybe gibba]
MFLRSRTRPPRYMPNQDQNPFSLERFADDEINIQDGQPMDDGVRHTPLAQAQDAKGNIFRFVFLIFAVAATVGSAWETTLLVCRLLQVSCSLQGHIGMVPGGFNVTHLCEMARSFHNLPSTSAQDRTIKAHDEHLKAVEDDIANILQIIPEPPLVCRNFALHIGGANVIPELTSPTHLLPTHTLKTGSSNGFKATTSSTITSTYPSLFSSLMLALGSAGSFWDCEGPLAFYSQMASR